MTELLSFNEISDIQKKEIKPIGRPLLAKEELSIDYKDVDMMTEYSSC